MKHTVRRWMALLLALSMSLSLLSDNGWAAEQEASPKVGSSSAAEVQEEASEDFSETANSLELSQGETGSHDNCPATEGTEEAAGEQPDESLAEKGTDEENAEEKPLEVHSTEEEPTGETVTGEQEEASEAEEDVVEADASPELPEDEAEEHPEGEFPMEQLRASDGGGILLLTLGKPCVYDSIEVGGVPRFSFTPEKDGVYAFYSKADTGVFEHSYHSGDEDTVGSLYDDQGTLLASDDNSGASNQCTVVHQLSAGRTYLFVVLPAQPGALSEFEVVVEEPSAVHSLEGSQVTWTIQDNILILSGQGAMPDFNDRTEQPWRHLQSLFKKVRVDPGVTEIGNHAFDVYNEGGGVTEAVIGNGVTRIGEEAFQGCHDLAFVSMPLNLEEIGKNAFCWCHSLTVAPISSSVKSIGDFAFFDCPAIQELTIPDSVTYLGEGSFQYCAGLKKVRIGNGLGRIGDSAFRFSELLSDVTIGSGVTAIGECAFYGCYSLISILIPDNVQIIESGAFFRSKLRTISLGKGLTDIGESAFRESDLTEIRIPYGVTRIGQNAFLQCFFLETLTIPESVKTIEKSAFEQCSGLTELTIPNSVVEIGDRAFSGCRKLGKVQLPSPLPSMGTDAFSGSVWWAKNYAESSGSCGDGVVWQYDKTTCTLTISGTGSITSPAYLENYAETWPYSIRKVIIQSGVTTIGQRAFSSCVTLSELIISEGVTTIEKSAFRTCLSLESVTIPDSVTTIKREAFSGCNNLSKVKLGKGLNTIGAHAFSCCNLKNVYIPEGVVSIGTSAFDSNEELTSIAIPKSVTKIYDHAFDDCKLLTIYCEAGSRAQIYAEQNGIKYAPLSAWTEDKTDLSKTDIYVPDELYTGKAIKPVPEVYYDDRMLKMGVDYTVSFRNNKKVGKATAILTGIGEYKGTVKKSFIIWPTKTVITGAKWDKKKKTLTLTWKKNKCGKGYQIQYSTNKRFKKNKRTLKINQNKKVKTTIKKLKKGKYYIRIRTVCGKYSSDWSKVRTLTVKK